MKQENNKEQLLKNDERREFLEKFGKLAATVPVGMLVLMGPEANAQNNPGSGGNDGAQG